MEVKYDLLNKYRLSRCMTMTAFAKEIGLKVSIVRRTLCGVTGPHDYNKVVFDKYIADHQEEIIKVCNILP